MCFKANMSFELNIFLAVYSGLGFALTCEVVISQCCTRNHFQKCRRQIQGNCGPQLIRGCSGPKMSASRLNKAFHKSHLISLCSACVAWDIAHGPLAPPAPRALIPMLRKRTGQGAEIATRSLVSSVRREHSGFHFFYPLDSNQDVTGKL
jgi:hypothetical protein